MRLGFNPFICDGGEGKEGKGEVLEERERNWKRKRLTQKARKIMGLRRNNTLNRAPKESQQFHYKHWSNNSAFTSLGHH